MRPLRYSTWAKAVGVAVERARVTGRKYTVRRTRTPVWANFALGLGEWSWEVREVEFIDDGPCWCAQCIGVDFGGKALVAIAGLKVAR